MLLGSETAVSALSEHATSLHDSRRGRWDDWCCRALHQRTKENWHGGSKKDGLGFLCRGMRIIGRLSEATQHVGTEGRSFAAW